MKILAIILALCSTLSAQGVRSATVADGGNRNVLWISNDNTTLFAQGFNVLYRSVDHGATWQSLHSFTSNASSNVYGVRQLSNGELLVSQANNGSSSAGLLFLSSGYPTLGASATWTQVLQAGNGIATNVYISGQWGMSSYNNIVVVSEYGGKTTNNNARYVYLSLDYGQTWKIIFDIGNSPDGQTHVHGTAYDPWWNAIWLVNGDTSANHKTRITFDFGNTWQVVDSANQFTGIIPLAGTVVFESDTSPSGMYTIARGSPDSIAAPSIAYNLGSGLIYQGQMPFRSPSTGLCLFPFTSATTEPGVVVGSYDGLHFATLWTDTITYGAGLGPLNIVGPMDNGLIYGALDDGRQSNYSKLTMQYVTSGMAGMKFGGLSFQ